MAHRLLRGDVLAVLPSLEAASFDACLCDPPYGLEFMGKEWDAPWKFGFSGFGFSDLKGRRPAPVFKSRRNPVCLVCHKHRRGSKGCRCDSPQWDESSASNARQLQGWFELWARELYRVLKPGAFLLAFGGTRTHHRLMCAIEDAGFEIRDTLMWLYGSGFPKSLDISKAIDKAAGAERAILERRTNGSGPHRIKLANHGKGDTGISYMDGSGKIFNVTAPATPEAARWSGYGTVLKPAWEPIILAMKPCEGMFAENAVKWGLAGLNVDAGRIRVEDSDRLLKGGSYSGNRTGSNARSIFNAGNRKIEYSAPPSRWPANLLLDEEAARALDRQSGQTTSRFRIEQKSGRADESQYRIKPTPGTVKDFGDSGGVSRFFYCAKAGRKERGDGNSHPTVKPLKLLEYLAALILPPIRETPRRLLVPFAGSGSEMIAGRRAGWDEVLGIEKSGEYCAIARRRLRARVPERRALRAPGVVATRQKTEQFPNRF